MPAGIPFGNSSYAIAAWFKADAGTNPLGQQNGIVGWGNYGSNDQVTAIRTATDIGGNGFRHYWWGNDQDVQANVFDGQFHHVVAMYDDAANVRQIFFDGVLIATQAIGDHFAAPTNFAIGRTAFGVFGLNEFFDGVLDDVAIFNRALTPAEISAIRAGNFSAFLPASNQIPEPATAGMLMLGAAALLRRRRAA